MTSESLPSPVAIDGAAASGKTTLGRALAERLGYRFLDTGLMYRAFTLAALQRGLEAEDADACAGLARALDMSVEANHDTRIIVDGVDVTGRLREPDVEANVSAYSAIPEVRDVMVALQRQVALRGKAVLAGRDIGTVVLPDAPLKVYLEASEDARAQRRGTQAEQHHSEARRDIQGRDVIDSSRATSPLRPAEDALVIDTTDLTVEEVVEQVVARLKSRAPSPQSPVAAPRERPRARRGGGAGRVRRWFSSWGVPAFYWSATYALRAALTVVGRWKAKGRERIPKEGGLIVVSNHLNNADPPILAAGIARRRIRFMAKIELFKWPFGAIPRMYGAFPVRRFDADVGALLTAERLLKRGEAIGMFPEGTRSRTGTLGTPHPGTALIAIRSGATVLPCAMTGTEQLRNPLNVLRKPRITLTIGEPMQVTQKKKPTEAEVTELTERIFGAIRDLLPAKYVGAYTESREAGDQPVGTDSPGI